MNDFAKLYRTDDIGQVLVTLESGEHGPEIRFAFNPEGFGICAVTISFESVCEDKRDVAEKWAVAGRAFDKITEEFALQHVRKSFYDTPLAEIRL